MDKQYKVYGITPSEPMQILRILIELQPGEDKAYINLSSIRVLQIQATSLIIETRSGPEVTTRVDYLTPSGIFHNDELSGVGIDSTEAESEYSHMELNFIGSRGGDTISLIIPRNKYSENQPLNKKYLQKIIERFAPDGYALEEQKSVVIDTLLDIFSDMTNKDLRLN